LLRSSWTMSLSSPDTFDKWTRSVRISDETMNGFASHAGNTCRAYKCRIRLWYTWQRLGEDCISNTHTRLTALCPVRPGRVGTRKVKPIWILLKQETVSGSGIRWAICKSAPCSPDRQPRQHPTAQFFTGQMPFLLPNQQHQSTEGISKYKYKIGLRSYHTCKNRSLPLDTERLASMLIRYQRYNRHLWVATIHQHYTIARYAHTKKLEDMQTKLLQ